MNFNDRIGMARRKPGTTGLLAGLLSVVAVIVGGLVAFTGLLVVWLSLVVGVVGFVGWWGWQRLRGRQPAAHLASILARRARRAAGHGTWPPGGAGRLREGEVVDVDMHEVPPAQGRRPGAADGAANSRF